MTETTFYKLSSTEQDALDELRKRIPKDLNQKLFDDPCLYYRFLKARDFDVDAAEKMLKNTLNWRKENEVDSILNNYTPPVVFHDIFKKKNICFDKEGCPVFYLQAGKLDYQGILRSITTKDMQRYLMFLLETYEKDLLTQAKKLNKRIFYVFTYDVAGLTFASATNKRAIEIFTWFCVILQTYYPERLKAIYIFNVSSFFTLTFTIIKQFIDINILKKVYLYGGEGWKEALATIIDINDIPAMLGGKKTDPDGNPLCLTIVYQPEKIDEKYYLCTTKKSLLKRPNVKKLLLSRASFLEIKIEILEPGSIIEWEFETKSRDIGFGLFFNNCSSGDEDEVVEELVSLQRLNTDEISETGMYKCEKAGNYVMLFDNSYSWIRSKEIYYILNIVTPKDHEKMMFDL